MSDSKGTRKGVVKWFDDTKGFGFILGEDGTEHFVHFSSISIQGRGYRSLQEGDDVLFDVGVSRASVQAVNVEKVTRL